MELHRCIVQPRRTNTTSSSRKPRHLSSIWTPKQNHQVPGDPASAFRGPPAIPNASERASRAEETRDRPKAASPICAQLGAIRATPVAPGKRSSFGSCVPELQGAETTPSSRIWVLPRSLNVLAYAPDTAVDRAIHLIFATVCWSRRQRNKYLDLFFRYLLLGLVLRASLHEPRTQRWGAKRN